MGDPPALSSACASSSSDGGHSSPPSSTHSLADLPPRCASGPHVPAEDSGASLAVPEAWQVSYPQATLTRTQLAQRIAKGETLVLRGRLVYKLDNWLSHHPGGDLAILHFVGRDAQDEILAYHSDQALQRMKRFAIATLVLPGDDNYPAAHSLEAQQDMQQHHLFTLAERSTLESQQPTRFRPLVPPIQLGYRKPNGLDHPHAHLDTWQRYLQRLSNLHLSGYPIPSPIQWERPQTFPLPLLLLEPGANATDLDPTYQDAISQDWRQLHKRIRQDGCYQLFFWSGYGIECIRYLFLALMAWYTFRISSQVTPESWSQTALIALSALFTGLTWHQITFVAHDAGHDGITHNHFIDHLIGTLIADLIGGLSLMWWTNNHDTHHLVTNHTEHDPDIQHMPFFAISTTFLTYQTDLDPSSIYQAQKIAYPNASQESPLPKNHSTTKGSVTKGLWTSYYRRIMLFDKISEFLVSKQHQLYYIVMSLARFNLYAQSYIYLFTRAPRTAWWYLELSLIPFYWVWMITCILSPLPTWASRIMWLLISHVCASPLHVQIVLSHFGQSTTERGFDECFASRQLRTTMDVSCSPSLEFIHGGLHMQVTHHLFPRLPRHNLRYVRDHYVRPWAQKWGLNYEEFTFTHGNGRVLNVLKNVADQVNLLAQVAQAQAKGKL